MNTTFKILTTLFTAIIITACGNKEKEEAPILRPVKYDTVSKKTSSQNKTFSGTAKTDKIINLSFRSSGIITTFDMKLGQIVKKGQLLAKLDNVQARLNYQNSISALNSSESQMNTAKLNYDRIRILYEKGSASLSDFESAKNSYKTAQQSFISAQRTVSIQEEQVKFGYIYASEDGVITSIQAEIDENVSPGQIVATLNAGTKMEIALGIPENVINSIHKGMKAKVSFASITETYNAEVTEASPALDLSSSTYPIRVTILEPSDKIKSGMAANVSFNLNKTDVGVSYLFTPVTSIGEDNKGNFVFLLEEKNNKIIVRKQNVKIGKLRPEGFEVISGLKEGQKVATAGLQTLLNGQEVKFQ